MNRPDSSVERAVSQILESGARVYVAGTGAGAALQSVLWSVPGASRFLVGASFPYAESAIDDFLGFTPERYTSPETAMDLAMESFLRAGAGPNAIGVGFSASVASLVAHRGDHRIHTAWLSSRGSGSLDVVLPKAVGVEARRRDGEITDRVGLNALLSALDLPTLPLPAPELHVTASERSELCRERLFARPHFRGGRRTEAPASLAAAFPGTFNPPHEGHFGMADAFAELHGSAPAFWITAEPPHKDPVPVHELLRRRVLLAGRDVLFTRGDPLYLDKARRYPGCSFVIGADAAARMLDPKWGPSPEELIAEFRELGTRFFVASRVDGERLVSLSDLLGAPEDVFAPLPGRWDVSSTERRGAR